MFKNGSFTLRLIGALLLVGLMIGGGVLAYQAGVAQGVAQAPEVAQALSDAVEEGGALPLPAYGFGRGYPAYWMHPHSGFFPFAGVIGFVLFMLLFFGLLRLVFFRHWVWHYGPMHGRGPWKGHSGYWGPPWEQGGEENQAETDSGKDKAR